MKTLALLIAAVALYSSNCTATYVYTQHCGYRPVVSPCAVVANRVYYYYPDLEIYWCPTVGSYAWFENDIWIVTMARPVWLAPTFSFVVIETELHDPWCRHEHYRTIYPRRQVVHRPAQVVVRHTEPKVIVHDHRPTTVVVHDHDRRVIVRDHNNHCDNPPGRRDDHDRSVTHIERHDSHDKYITINPSRPDVKNDRDGCDKHQETRNDKDKGKGKVKNNDHNRDGHTDNGWVNNPRNDRKMTPAQNSTKNQNNGNKGNQYTRGTKENVKSNGSTTANNHRSAGVKKAAKSQSGRGHISKR
jgi:hypothetical protein